MSRRSCNGHAIEMARWSANGIKTAGYFVSTLSVVALGIVSWKAASKDNLLIVSLVAGVSLSVLGMIFRWISYQVQEHEDNSRG